VNLLKQVYSLSDIQVLSMSSTGTILAAVSPDAMDKVEAVLRQNGIESKNLGSFTKELQGVLIKNGKEQVFPIEVYDPHARVVSAIILD